MTVEINPPALGGAKPFAVGVTGAALGLSAFGASAAIVTHTPDGGSLTANNLSGSETQAIAFDLTDLGAITSSVVTLVDASLPQVGYLYLIAEAGNIAPDFSGPLAAYQDGDDISPGGIAKSGFLKAAIFEQNDLIDASAFSVPIADAGVGKIKDTPTGVSRFIGFAIGPTLQTASIGWVQFTLGSISSTGLAINTTAGQGICAGGGAPIGGSCSSVPVPPSLALLASGMVGLAAVRRRRKLDA